MRIPLLKTGAVLVLALTAGTAWQQGRRQGLAEAAALRRSILADAHTDAAAAVRTAGPSPGSETPTGAEGPPPPPPADSREFAARMREALADPLESRRLACLQTLLDQCSPDWFAAVIPLLRENSLEVSAGSDAERALIMWNWGRRDGAGAMAFIDSHNWTGWRFPPQDGGRREALAGWAMADPQAALAWFSGSPYNNGQDSGLQDCLITGWVAGDAEEAARWVLAEGPPFPLSTTAYEEIVNAICRRRGGQTGLDQWFDSLPADSPALASMARAVVKMKSQLQPEKTAEWIESRQDRLWAADETLIHTAAGRLAERDPAAAMAWADRIGSAHAASAAMWSWCFRDVGTASEWLSANPSTAHYDAAAEQLIIAISAEDPEAARTWAGTIRNPALRRTAVERLSAPQVQWSSGIPGGGRAAGNPKLSRLYGSGRPPVLTDEVSEP